MDRIALPATGLPQYSFDGNSFSVLDDTGNPTLSYKDRATSLVVAKAIEMGITEIAAASTGNAGSSLAGISARLGIRSHIFVPQNIPLGKRIQIQSFGAAIYIIKGSYDDAFDLSLEISNQKKWYNRNTAYNPLTIEGKKSSAFDIFILSQGKMPDNIFVPVGDGVIIAGIYRGLEDLLKLGWIEKLPKLIALQAKGSDAVCRYMKDKSFSFIEASTIADSISAGAPRNLYHAAHAIAQSGGEAIAVTDEDILKAQKTMVQKTGILVEPSCSITFAGYQQYKAAGKLKEGESSLLMLTGNGLKDTNSLAKWNDTPDILSYQEWKDYFSKA
jgi:threonine synthase